MSNSLSSKNSPSKKLVVILGPTAVGKTALSIKLAKKFNGEIVSADSRQLYKQMDIGTAKPTKKEKEGVPHYLLDITTPDKPFSVAEYQKLATKKINEITAKEKTPFLVGGTAFYIYSVIEGWHFPEIKTNQKLRRNLEKKSLSELSVLLKRLDPERASTIEQKNKRRLIRAIEIADALGKVPKLKKNPQFKCLVLGIKPEKETLQKKISQRVDKMLKQGLEKEAKKLAEKYGFNVPPMQTIGYQEFEEYFQGKIAKPELKEKIKLHTMQFAKRQMTWFKRDKRIRWIKNQKEAGGLLESFLNPRP